eukprot:Skav225141  [mRNA]  locus=scaffold1056:178571:181910:- [translate_table: standard]
MAQKLKHIEICLVFSFEAFLEESAEGWKLEQQALLKGQELAEEAAEEAERQATEEAAKHLAEGKLVPGANLEVILTDPGPVGLTFYADDSEPPRVRKVKKDRREFWDKQGMKDGAAILAVGDTPTAKLTSAELLPLLNGRPLRLQFALDGGQGINGTDGSGQTALHKAMEAGDEAAALDILANPDFKAINMQDYCHPEFRSQDAVDYRGITAYEDAEAAGQMEAGTAEGLLKSEEIEKWTCNECEAVPPGPEVTGWEASAVRCTSQSLQQLLDKGCYKELPRSFWSLDLRRASEVRHVQGQGAACRKCGNAMRSDRTKLC